MAFGHEKLDAYRAAVEYVGWAYRLDVLGVCGAISAAENENAKALLDRIVAMLTKLGQRGYAIREEPGESEIQEIDPDTDTDPDADGDRNEPEPTGWGFAPCHPLRAVVPAAAYGSRVSSSRSDQTKRTRRPPRRA